MSAWKDIDATTMTASCQQCGKSATATKEEPLVVTGAALGAHCPRHQAREDATPVEPAFSEDR